MATHVLRVPVSTGDTTLLNAVRDDLITGDNGGVKFIADLGFSWSYPAGTLPRAAATAPVSGAVVRDISENKNGQSVGLSGALNISYAGGGFDFTNCTNVNDEVGIEIPATVSADIFTNQEYLLCVYMKLPSLANWNTQSSLQGMITASGANGTYQNDTEIVLIAQQRPTATNGILSVRFQSAAGTASPNLTLSIPAGTDMYDNAIVQVSAWVSGGNAYARVKTATTEVLSSSAFSGNAVNFSASTIKVGGSSSGFNVSTTQPSVQEYRAYRTFVENLNTSGRNAVTVLDADLTRVIARNVFS